MRVLSVSQPWASLIIRDVKSIETRSWSTKYRGPVLIHASKTFPTTHRRFYSECVYNVIPDSADQLPLGAIVGVVTLFDVWPTADLVALDQEREPGAPLYGRLPSGPTPPSSYWDPGGSWLKRFGGERDLGDYTPGRFAWLLHKAVEFKQPIPHKGSLGLTRLTDQLVLDEVTRQLSTGGTYAESNCSTAIR